MLWRSARHLPVVTGGRLVGILSDRDITRERLEEGARVEQIMVRQPEVAAPDDLIDEAAQRMSRGQIGSLPVVDADHMLLGIITSSDLLSHMGRQLDLQEAASGPRVRDIACDSPSMVTTGTPLAEAVAEMVARNVRHMPIVDGERRLIGIISERDVRALVGDPTAAIHDDTVYGEGAAMRMPVDDVMTADPIAVHRDAPVGALARAFLDDRVGAVPVIDDDVRLLGIVSYIDVVHAALRGGQLKFTE